MEWQQIASVAIILGLMALIVYWIVKSHKKSAVQQIKVSRLLLKEKPGKSNPTRRHKQGKP